MPPIIKRLSHPFNLFTYGWAQTLDIQKHKCFHLSTNMRLKNFIRTFYQKLRLYFYTLLSDNNNVVGRPVRNQPVLYKGEGRIEFGKDVLLGYFPSPYFFEGSIYLEARSKEAVIRFGSKILVNNNLKIICDKTSVTIGNDVLIGTNVEIIDSDFHGIHPDERRSNNYKCLPVIIENNVFIGSNAKIMKGVRIGANSIVGGSAVVTKDVPEGVIVSGNPAKVIKSVYS